MKKRAPRPAAVRAGTAPEPPVSSAEPPAQPRTAWPSLRLRIDWRIAAGQVLLTALGVALAMAGSAWWSDRQERIRERSELRNALGAARETERRLRQALHEDSLSLAANERLMTARASVPDDSLYGLFIDGQQYADARAVVTPFAAMIQNGDIHLVRDARLRAMLPAYVGEIQTRTHEVDEFNAIQKQVLLRYPAILTLRPRPPAREHAAALRADPEVWRLVWLSATANGNMLSQNRIMLRATSALRAELERVLGERPVPLPQPRLRRDSFLHPPERARLPMDG